MSSRCSSPNPPRPDLATRRRALVYHDDFHVLAPYRSPATMGYPPRPSSPRCARFATCSTPMAAEQLADVRRNEQFWRTTLGGQQYEDLERFARQRMQEPFFGRGGLRPSDVAMLFNLGGRGSSFDGSRIWDQTSTSEPSKKCPRPRQRAAHLPAAARPRHPEAAFPLRLHHWACRYGRTARIDTNWRHPLRGVATAACARRLTRFRRAWPSSPT